MALRPSYQGLSRTGWKTLKTSRCYGKICIPQPAGEKLLAVARWNWSHVWMEEIWKSMAQSWNTEYSPYCCNRHFKRSSSFKWAFSCDTFRFHYHLVSSWKIFAEKSVFHVIIYTIYQRILLSDQFHLVTPSNHLPTNRGIHISLNWCLSGGCWAVLSDLGQTLATMASKMYLFYVWMHASDTSKNNLMLILRHRKYK